MLYTTVLAAAAFGVASAQNTIRVLVGMGADGQTGNVFSPNKITANPGDRVQFQFVGGNHTVTQSNFDNPCIPISMVNASNVGFHSSYFPAMNALQTGQIPAWNLQINDTSTIWAYCAQGRHCQGGMGLVINENTAANQTRSLENYQAQAANVAQAMVPAGGLANGGQPGAADPNAVAGGQPGQPGQPGATGGQPGADGQQQPGAASSLQISTMAIAIAAGAAYFL